MTFAEGVLRLVRGGSTTEPEVAAPADGAVDSLDPLEAVPELGSLESAHAVEWVNRPEWARALEAGDASESGESVEAALHEPGFADIEAAVELVSTGLARRMVLANFQSWPGLLWRAYQLAEQSDVLILPTVVRPGGRVDIVVMREKPE